MAPRVSNYRLPTEWMELGRCAVGPAPEPPPLLELSPEDAARWQQEWTLNAQKRRYAIFFPDSAVSAPEAKRICNDGGGCPVKSECLSYALRTGQGHGVWGGLTENERRKLRRHSTQPVEVDQRRFQFAT